MYGCVTETTGHVCRWRGGADGSLECRNLASFTRTCEVIVQAGVATGTVLDHHCSYQGVQAYCKWKVMFVLATPIEQSDTYNKYRFLLRELQLSCKAGPFFDFSKLQLCTI